MTGSVVNGAEKTQGRALVDMVAGGLAGAVSRVVVGPLDVVKIRMQVQLEPIRAGATSKYTGITQALSTIAREEGIVVRFLACVDGPHISGPVPAGVACIATQHFHSCTYPYSSVSSRSCFLKYILQFSLIVGCLIVGVNDFF